MSSEDHQEILNKVAWGEDLLSSELIEIQATHSTLHKKLACQYVIDRSLLDSNLGLLTGNQILKDCSDANPILRSCSIYALSSLKGMEDAALGALLKAMKDSAPQVRRTAVLACIVLFKKSPSFVLESGLVDSLYEAIGDSDPIVATNSLLSLDSILKKDGSVVVTRKMSNHLLKRLHQFSECNLVYVFNVLTKYKPKDETETFEILNMIDWVFCSVNGAALFAALEYFIAVTENHRNLQKDVLEMVKPGIQKILSQKSPELSYAVIDFLIGNGSGKLDLRSTFGQSYKYFLVHANDPEYLKTCKLKLLPLLVTEENSKEVISEIKRYVTDLNVNLDSAFKALLDIATLNEDIQATVLSAISPILGLSNSSAQLAGLKCLLHLLLKDSHFLKQRSSLARLNSFDYLRGYPVSDSASGDDKSKSSVSDLPPSYIVNVLPSIRNILTIDDCDHLSTTELYALGVFCPFMFDAAHFVEVYLEKFKPLTSQCKKILLNVCTTVFKYWPASTQYLLSKALAMAENDERSSVRIHASFIYACLAEGKLDMIDVVVTSLVDKAGKG